LRPAPNADHDTLRSDFASCREADHKSRQKKILLRNSVEHVRIPDFLTIVPQGPPARNDFAEAREFQFLSNPIEVQTNADPDAYGL
jgi:hypothetical protein